MTMNKLKSEGNFVILGLPKADVNTAALCLSKILTSLCFEQETVDGVRCAGHVGQWDLPQKAINTHVDTED